jgi:hypothetical protein
MNGRLPTYEAPNPPRPRRELRRQPTTWATDLRPSQAAVTARHIDKAVNHRVILRWSHSGRECLERPKRPFSAPNRTLLLRLHGQPRCLAAHGCLLMGALSALAYRGWSALTGAVTTVRSPTGLVDIRKSFVVGNHDIFIGSNRT